MHELACVCVCFCLYMCVRACVSAPKFHEADYTAATAEAACSLQPSDTMHVCVSRRVCVCVCVDG